MVVAGPCTLDHASQILKWHIRKHIVGSASVMPSAPVRLGNYSQHSS